MSERPEVPLTVKPRKAVTVTTGVTEFSGPYLVIQFAPSPDAHWDENLLLIEQTGEILPLSELPRVVLTSERFIFVARDASRSLLALNDTFENDPAWQFRLTPIDREIWQPNREGKPTTVRQVVINFFGFRKGFGRKDNLYHQVLDPHMFLHRFSLDDLVPGDMGELEKLKTWAILLRDWALMNGLTMKPTAGSLAAQLLRDPRFYPNPRRKVPRATNHRAREVLPGNYYLLRAEEKRAYDAVYIDQVSAHHNCAATVTLPDADRLYAKGAFHKLDSGRIWARRDCRLYARAIREPGLFYLQVKNPLAWNKDVFPLPCQLKPGFQRIFVWSNELEYLQETGTTIAGIIAAWTSDRVDTGISAYARWALAQTQNAPPGATGWLKPTLLASYGILAAAPHRFETAYRRSEKGERAVYPLAGELVEVQRYRAQTSHESGIANVIHRGIIEAETRLRSIRLARELTLAGYNVLAIYADSVFIESTPHLPLPLVDHSWSIKGELTHLQFFNATSFHSNELTKLPGIPKDDADRIKRVRSARAFFAELAAIERGERRGRGRSVRPG